MHHGKSCNYVCSLLSAVYFQATLLYFGLRFLRLKISDHEPFTESVNLNSEQPWPGWSTFKSFIKADLDCLNTAAIGAKLERDKKDFNEWVADGTFEPIRHTNPIIFVYHHTFHSACSSVGFKQLRDAGVHVRIKPVALGKCTRNQHKVHNLFLPFFVTITALNLYTMKE